MRRKDEDWNLPAAVDWGHVKVALLMDLRDELKLIRQALQPLQHLNCSNFQAMPSYMRQIVRNTTRKRRRKAAK